MWQYNRTFITFISILSFSTILGFVVNGPGVQLLMLRSGLLMFDFQLDIGKCSNLLWLTLHHYVITVILSSVSFSDLDIAVEGI